MNFMNEPLYCNSYLEMLEFTFCHILNGKLWFAFGFYMFYRRFERLKPAFEGWRQFLRNNKRNYRLQECYEWSASSDCQSQLNRHKILITTGRISLFMPGCACIYQQKHKLFHKLLSAHRTDLFCYSKAKPINTNYVLSCSFYVLVLFSHRFYWYQFPVNFDNFKYVECTVCSKSG